MHIVYLTHEYPKKGLNGGGIGSFVQFLGRSLVKKGIMVSVVGMNNSVEEIEEIDEGVKIYRLAKSTWKFAKFLDNSKRICEKIAEIDNENKVTIVEGSELNFAFFPKNTSYKKIIRLHGGHHFFAIELAKKPALWRGFQEKQSFKKADAYVAVSDYVGKQTRKYLNYNFDYTTIYNTVDTDIFKPNNTAVPIENQLLFFGTVCEKKGVKQLVQAMSLIKEVIPNVSLKIVGRDWFYTDGRSYIDELKTYISPNVSNAIEIVGAVPHHEIKKQINQAQLCAFPSHMEAMPIAWLEALAMGKAVVASNIGPGRELIIDGESGVLIDPYSPEDISEKIIALLLDKDKISSLEKAAVKQVVDNFNVNDIIQYNIDFYRKIIN